MSIKMLAFGLLLGRAVSLTFIILVLRRQWQLLKLPIEREIKTFRKILFILSCAILAGNIIPVIIDVLTLFVNTGRPPQVRAISIAYAYSNSLTAATSSLLIWFLYRLAAIRPSDSLEKSVQPIAEIKVPKKGTK